MASVASVTRTVKDVTLTLTADEALTIQMILAFVGGHPDRSRRGDADQISAALSSAGIHYSPPWESGRDPFSNEMSVGGPSLMFRDRLETN